MGRENFGESISIRPSREPVIPTILYLARMAIVDVAILLTVPPRDRIDGISEKMLSQTLRDLERDGVLLRTSRPVVPPYVDYRLTEMGTAVAQHVSELVRWVETHMQEFVSAQSDHERA